MSSKFVPASEEEIARRVPVQKTPVAPVAPTAPAKKTATPKAEDKS